MTKLPEEARELEFAVDGEWKCPVCGVVIIDEEVADFGDNLGDRHDVIGIWCYTCQNCGAALDLVPTRVVISYDPEIQDAELAEGEGETK